MKQIQVQTIEMKANVEVIALNSAFVARTTKCMFNLNLLGRRLNFYSEEEREMFDELEQFFNDIYEAFAGKEEPKSKKESKSDGPLPEKTRV